MTNIQRGELQFALALVGRLEHQMAALRWRQGETPGRVGCEIEGLGIRIGDIPGTDDLHFQVDDADGAPMLSLHLTASANPDRLYLKTTLAGLYRAAQTAKTAEPVRLAEPLDAAEEARLARLVTRLSPTTRREPRASQGWTATAARLSAYLPRPRALPQGGVAQDGLDIGMLGTPA